MQDTYNKNTQAVFITIILMRLLGMWYVSNKKEKIIADVSLGVVLVSMIFSCMVQCNEFYHSRTSLMLMCDAAPTFFTLFSEQMKLLIFCKNRKDVMRLNKYMYENFWNVKYNKEETKQFNECNKSCIKVLTSFLIIMIYASILYILTPYLEPSDNTSYVVKKLPFPIYVYYPIFETPVYEILFVLEVFGLFGIVLCFLSFPSFLMVTNMFTAAQFKMLKLRMQAVCKFPENTYGNVNLQLQVNAYDELKNCIRKHQLLIHHVNQMENLYCYAMLGQIIASMFQIGSATIPILVSSQGEISTGKAALRLVILTASTMQFYFYAFPSHEILIESEKLSEAICSSNWFQITHPRYQKHFSLLVQIVSVRAQRPCILTVGKYCPLTLNTFTTIMRMSMSFFTVMRQTLDR